jgi:hypothetical protein
VVHVHFRFGVVTLRAAAHVAKQWRFKICVRRAVSRHAQCANESCTACVKEIVSHSSRSFNDQTLISPLVAINGATLPVLYVARERRSPIQSIYHKRNVQ